MIIVPGIVGLVWMQMRLECSMLARLDIEIIAFEQRHLDGEIASKSALHVLRL